MESKVIKVRVAEPGTSEEQITEFMLATTTTFVKDQMVKYLKMAPATFYIRPDGTQAKLTVGKKEDGSTYIQTVGESTAENNLLSLPRF